jgi:Tol biopolymer transport system component
MTTLRLPSLFLFGALLGCGSHDSPGITNTPPEVPSLESVSFPLLGSGKIAFERIGGGGSYGAIYVVDATAGRSTHVFDNAAVLGPALSPDGQLLAYTFSNNTANYDVYVANVDGSGAQHVTNFPQQEGPPTWTTDGARIMFVAGDFTSVIFNVFSQSPVPNPGNLTQFTHFATGPGGQVVCPIIVGNDPTVSSSSQGLLAFACQGLEIDILSPDGSLSASYVPSRNDRRNWPLEFSPKWSPDGTRLAFIETISDSATNYSLVAVTVKVINADGTNATTIASAPGPNAPPMNGGWAGLNNLSLCWMPDGSRLVFNVPESDLVGHLWVVRSDGTGLAQLTSSPGVWDRSVSCSRS